MSKIYEYKGKHYCEEDLSMTDEDYGGDLFDLFFDMEQDGLVCSERIYYSPDNPEDIYEDAELLVEDYCYNMVIGDTDK